MRRNQAQRPLKWYGQTGLSLLELLIVITLISLIASISIPRFLLMLERARCAQAISDLKVVQVAWYTGPGSGTSETESCPIKLSLFIRHPWGTIKDLLPSTNLPIKDPWGRAYMFALTGNQKHLVMCSGGKQGFGLEVKNGDPLEGLDECDCEGHACGESPSSATKLASQPPPTKELVMISP